MRLAVWLKSVAASMVVPTSRIVPSAVRETLPLREMMAEVTAVEEPDSVLVRWSLTWRPIPALLLASALASTLASALALASASAAKPLLPAPALALAPALASALASALAPASAYRPARVKPTLSFE